MKKAPFRDKVKSVARCVLYALGVFGWMHRRRNKDTLTTFMFHRVLPRDSQAYRYAEQEYTFTTDGFAACLDFIERHYHVVSLSDMEAAISKGRALPPCAALITFDDGWRDTLEHAGPELKRRNLPAVMFIASEILDENRPRWWQDALVSVLATPAAAQLAHELELPQALCTQAGQQRSHQMAAALSCRQIDERHRILAPYLNQSVPGRQMINRSDLAALHTTTIDLAAHGHTHAPLTCVDNPQFELRQSLNLVLAAGGHASMSFPHGAFTETLRAMAAQAGFSTIFTSESSLSGRLSNDSSVRALGRIHVPENEWTCENEKVSFAKLATFLFFRPITSPD